MSASTSHAAPESPNPIREVTIRQGARLASSVQTPNVARASTIVSDRGAIPFRPLDASLLEAIAVSKGGDIWIAPIRNGAQTSGTSERVVVFDPGKSHMSAFKIGRLASEITSVVPIRDDGVWTGFGHLPALRRSFASGASEIFVAPSDDDETLALAVTPSGDAIASEPLRATIARVAGASGAWSIVDGHSTTEPSKSVVDGAGDVAFAKGAVPEIVRRMADGSVSHVVIAQLSEIDKLDMGPGGDVWFFGDNGIFGELPPGSSVPSLWRLPRFFGTLAAGSDGQAWLLNPPRLIAFDARTSTGTVITSVSKYASDVASDGSEGAWVEDPTGLTHVGSDQTSTAYLVHGISPTSPVASDASRVCFAIEYQPVVDDDWNDERPACLNPKEDRVNVYADRFLPGINGVTSDGDDMLLLENGRATLVDKKLSIPRYIYPSLNTGPTGAVALPDRSIWLAGTGRIQRFTSSGEPETYRLTYPGNGPFGLAQDRRGGVLFAIGHAVGDISVDGGGTEHLRYFATGPSSSPEAMVTSSDGTIWCTDTGGWILRIDSSRAVKRYRTPTSPSEPFGIAIGPDHAIWFTEFFSGKIGRLDPRTGSIAEFRIPYAQSFPTGITAGAHDLWFLDLNNNIGRVTTAGRITEYPILAQSAVAY